MLGETGCRGRESGVATTERWVPRRRWKEAGRYLQGPSAPTQHREQISDFRREHDAVMAKLDGEEFSDTKVLLDEC